MAARMTGISATTDSDSAGRATIDVDRTGSIVAASGALQTLLGGQDGQLIGRDLFRDVAPAMNTPVVFGRFLEGIRAGKLDESFSFVLGRETGAVRLDIRFHDGPAPGLYRVALAATHVYAPSRHRDAMLAVDQRARSELVDPLVCEREPIHIPGSIQPPNGLLGIDLATFVVTVASENIAEILGPALADILGKPLSEVLPARFVATIRADLAAGKVPSGSPHRYDLTAGERNRPFAVMVHRQDERLILELEATPLHPGDFGVPTASTLKEAIRTLRRQESVAALAATIVDLVRDLTGYERVLVYRFDREWTGEAIAESIVPDWEESLLGLRFPSSDIPRQARELYLRSPARIVIDRDATPIPLTSSGADNRPVDLTFSTLRSMSPVHIEYQRNLGVNGSMSMAILIDGRLWGLLIGHHRRPHYVAPETRDAVAVLVEALALGISDVEQQAFRAVQAAYFSGQVALLRQMAGAEDVATALSQGEARLTDLFGATGAAVVIGESVSPIGDAPPADLILALAHRIRQEPPGAPSVTTDNLSAYAGDVPVTPDQASGMLAAFTDPARDGLLIWFRPEVVRRIVWGGDPSKPVMADVRTAAVLPRRSFERWVEERRGYSPPWEPWQVEIAETLARAVDGLSLRASRRIAELATKQDELIAALAQKDRLLADKDLLTREIDHRVKNSLQIVSAFLQMQSRKVKDPEAQDAFRATFGRVMSIARVHDSLYQSDNVTDVDLGQTIETLCRDLSDVGGEKRDLELVAERGLMVPYRKAVALSLIATELVTNAWKYAYPDAAPGLVEVTVGRHEGGVRLRVCDQGAGLPPDWENQRKGLGMQLIRTMLNQIDATLHVESNSGACFTVRC